MLCRLTAFLAVGLITSLAIAPPASAEPPVVEPLAADAPPADPNIVPPAAPIVVPTPDGWELYVEGINEKLTPVAPLTTAVTSREYEVEGTFSGMAKGAGNTTLTGGTLEAGYRIGCGIGVFGLDLQVNTAIVPEVGWGGGLLPDIAFPTVGGVARVMLTPGVVNIVPVGKKTFKGNGARVNISGFRIKIEGCVGQSFIQSYATVGISTDDTEDVATYLGTVRVV